MKLKISNYNNIDIKNEIEKILSAEEVEIVLEPKNKVCLFLLGIIFAYGKKIKLSNIEDLDLESTNKSFSLMTYVWSKLSDDKFPNFDYSNEDEMKKVSERDIIIEHIKRLGVWVEPFKESPNKNKIFLICPVREATQEQKKWIENFVIEKLAQGYTIHAPHIHTTQVDLFGGYTICKQNAEAIATSSEVDIYYDQKSTGSAFDLGVAYALNKPLVLLNKNDIEFNEEDFIDNILIRWAVNKSSNLSKKLIKNNKI